MKIFGFSRLRVNKIHGSRSKIISKKSRHAALCGGIYSSVKGLNKHIKERT
jgi:hypothetical protein